MPQSGAPSRLPTGPLRVEGALLLESLSKGNVPVSRPLPSPTFSLPNEIWQLLKIAQCCSRHCACPSAGWHTAGGGRCGQTLAHTGPGVGVTHTVHNGTEQGAGGGCRPSSLLTFPCLEWGVAGRGGGTAVLQLVRPLISPRHPLQRV